MPTSWVQPTGDLHWEHDQPVNAFLSSSSQSSSIRHGKLQSWYAKNEEILPQIKIFSAMKNNCQIIEHDLAVLCAHFWISQKNFFASTWLGSFFGATVLFGRICSKFTPCFKHWTGICSVGIWYCISWQAAELGAASCLEHATWPFVYLDHN